MFECPFGSYCKVSDACGAGVCIDGPPGCNGLTGCSEPPPAYAAISYGLNLHRLVFMKNDPVRDVCIKITVDKGEEEGLPFELGLAEPWRLREIIATDQALDCRASMGGCDLPGVGEQAAAAISASGSLTIEEQPGNVPPNVGAQLALGFDQPWLEAQEMFEIAPIETAGGPCP